MKLEGYIVSTQRGYAYGLVDKSGQRYIELYTRCHWSEGKAGIDRAWSEASKNVSALELTYIKTPELLNLNPEQYPGKLWQ